MTGTSTKGSVVHRTHDCIKDITTWVWEHFMKLSQFVFKWLYSDFIYARPSLHPFFFLSRSNQFTSAHVCPLNVKLEMNFRSPKNASILNLMLPNDFHIGSLCFSLARQTSESTWTSKGSEWLFLPVLNGQQTVEVNVTAGVDKKNLSLRSSETLPLTSAFDLLTAILKSNRKNDIQCVPV